MTTALFESLQRIERMIWPMLTRATRPTALPHAPRIPDDNRSAPAHESVLWARMTWWGWARTRKWNESLPDVLTTYLLAQIRDASSASDEICSYSFETKWTLQTRNNAVSSFEN